MQKVFLVSVLRILTHVFRSVDRGTKQSVRTFHVQIYETVIDKNPYSGSALTRGFNFGCCPSSVTAVLIAREAKLGMYRLKTLDVP